MRKVTFDQYPFAISTDNKQWIVVFHLHNVEFATQPMTLKEAKWISSRIRDRITDWATGGLEDRMAWVEEG